MKSNRYLPALLPVLLLLLTGCPYKETYRRVSQQPVNIDGTEITPLTLFYSSRHKISYCDVSFRIRNLADSTQNLQFAGSLLANANKTVVHDTVYAYGKAYPKDNIFRIPPKTDSLLAIAFHDSSGHFTDTIEVFLHLGGRKETRFKYARIRK